MATTKYQDTNLNCYRGDREAYTFTVTSGGAAYNLTGYTVRAVGRAHPDEGVLLYDSAVTTGMAITDAAGGNVFSTGTIIFVITAAVTALLPDLHYYDIQATSGTTVVTIARGKVTLHKDITR